jgi:hypothetical protein
VRGRDHSRTVGDATRRSWKIGSGTGTIAASRRDPGPVRRMREYDHVLRQVARGRSDMTSPFAWLTRRRRLAALTVFWCSSRFPAFTCRAFIRSASCAVPCIAPVRLRVRWATGCSAWSRILWGTMRRCGAWSWRWRKGTGSYAWAGAAGFADPQVGARLTRDTPIYIASVTKVYIATLVMLLSQAKRLSLDDPMS